MIGLVTLLQASGVAFSPSGTKVHLACWNGHDHPIEIYYAGRFQQWQEHQTRQNFGCEHVVSLIDLGAGMWMFAGVYEVHGVGPHPKSPGQPGILWA